MQWVTELQKDVLERGQRYLNRDWKESGGLDRNSGFMVRWRVSLIKRKKYALEHHSGVRREDGKRSTITLGTIERVAGSTTAENLGVNLQESKQIANRLQDTVLKQQVHEHCEERRKCLNCGKQRPMKDFRCRRLDAVLGTVRLRVSRYRRCQRRSGLWSYLIANQTRLINYGREYREGNRISTARVESTVDQLVDWRMQKKQHMRWTRFGAQMLLHARCALINGELGKYTGLGAQRFIAGAGRAGMNPQILSSPDLSTVRQ